MIVAMIQRLKQQLEKQHAPFLNSSAILEAIEAAEKEMGVTFPADLKALYLTHNGEMADGPGLFFGFSFLSLEGMLTEWKLLATLNKNREPQITESSSVPNLWIKEQYINPSWIPIGTDYEGNYLGVDLAPDLNGKMGQIINFGRKATIKYVIAYNIKEWIAFILKTLNR